MTASALESLQLLPPPGEPKARAVPEWQIELLRRADLVKRMNGSLAKLAKIAKGDGIRD